MGGLSAGGVSRPGCGELWMQRMPERWRLTSAGATCKSRRIRALNGVRFWPNRHPKWGNAQSRHFYAKKAQLLDRVIRRVANTHSRPGLQRDREVGMKRQLVGLCVLEGVLLANCGGLTAARNGRAVISVLNDAPQASVVLGQFPVRFFVHLTNADGSDDAHAPVIFAAPSNGPSGTFPTGVSSLETTSDQYGDAEAPPFRANSVAGSYLVIVSSPGILGSAEFDLHNQPGPAAILSALGVATAHVGTQVSGAAVRVTDAEGNPVGGAQIVFGLPSSGPAAAFTSGALSALASSDFDGIASAPPLIANHIAGPFTISASLGPRGPSVTLSATNLPGPPVTLDIVAGGDQQSTVLTPFPAPLCAVVNDIYDNPVPNVLVTFTAPTSGPSASLGAGQSAPVVTDSSGRATSPIPIANTGAGSYRVAAVAATLPAVTFQLTNLPGPPARIVPVAGSGQSATATALFPVALQALVTDAEGNPAPGALVIFTAPGQGPSGIFSDGASAAAVQTDASGAATAPSLAATFSAGSFVVTATVASVTTGADFALTTLPTASAAVSTADAERFLEQSGFGPTPTQVANIQINGLPHYLQEQLAAPPSVYPQDPKVTMQELWSAYFTNAIAGPDQLRQRVGLALSEILVASGLDEGPPSMAYYLNTIQANAFGTFYDLLRAITLTPALGAFLNIAGNNKADPATGTRPNENYARELMQLFTVGLERLNPDGTPIIGPGGAPVPTYDQSVVEENARVLTGWTYALDPSGSPLFTAPMVANEAQHDTGAKQLIDGVTIPAGGTAESDLNILLHTLVDDSNTGPFICKQLIQHLTTSNPSPQYVSRVVAVFNDDGQGVRGNLAAVVAAILLDPEARGSASADPGFGRLVEPAVYIATLLRELGGTTDGVVPAATAAAMGQLIFEPASVFGYFSPDYSIQVAGATFLAPEMSLESYSTEVERQAFVHALVTGQLGTGTAISLARLLPAARAGIAPLLQAVDTILMAGQMSTQEMEIIGSALQQMKDASSIDLIVNAIELAATSPEYIVAH